MKIIIFIMAIYYISSNALDGNDGLSIDSPWSISNLNAATLSPGDQVLLKRGDTFNEFVVIDNSGLPGNVISLSTYGTGSNPIISGFTEITDWTNKGSNIWESTNAVSTLSNCNMVTVGGVNTPMGSWPNRVSLPSDLSANDGSWIYGSTFHSKTSFTNEAISGQDWTGATVVIRPYKFVYQKGLITDHTDGTITHTPDNDFTPALFAGFFIQNHINTLTDQNEWFYDSSTKKLSIYSTYEPQNVKIASIENIITINGNYVSIENLSIEGANTGGLYIGEVSNTSISNCDIKFTLNGIYSEAGQYASDIVISDNTITDSNNCGVILRYKQALINCYGNTLISGNNITNTGLYAGMGTSKSNDYSGIYALYIENATIIYNSILNVGHNGIDVAGSETTTVTKNYIDNYCLMLDDGGGIYTNTACTWRIISKNIITNGIGNIQGYNYNPDGSISRYNHAYGIYLDNGGDNDNNHVIQNVTYNALIGIFWASAHNSTVKNNLVYNTNGGIANDSAFVEAVDYVFEVSGNIVFLAIAQEAPDYDACLIFGDGSGVYSPLVAINNNYYCRPEIQEDAVYNLGFGGNNHGSIAEWFAFSGFDEESLAFDSDADGSSSPLFIYNNSLVITETVLTSPYIEANGIKHYGKIYLKPFEGMVLLSDDAPDNIIGVPIMHELYYYDLLSDAEVLSSDIHDYLTTNRTGYNATSWGSPILVDGKYRVKVPVDMVEQRWGGIVNIEYQLLNSTT